MAGVLLTPLDSMYYSQIGFNLVSVQVCKCQNFMVDLFPGIPDQFPGKREGQKSPISREFSSREFPGGNSSQE